MKPTPNSASQLEEELRRQRPCDAPPADLHRSILDAVRSARSEPAPRAASPLWRWMVALALAVLVASVSWMSWPRRPAVTPAWTMAAATLERAHAMPQQASAVALAPLSEELEFLDRDVRRAVDVLLASVP